MRARKLSRLGGENGAVAVIAALLLTVLLLFAALALDLGALRADRASGQLVADMAATAGAFVHDASQPGSARSACEQAVAYASENLDTDLVVDPDGAGGCELFSETDVCAPDGEPITARYRSGGLFVSITNPVPDPLDDPTGLMQDVSYAFDGTPCDRIGVRIRRDRDFLLAPVGGSDQTFQSGSTTRSAVAASLISGQPADFASLIVLQRAGCRTLEGAGGGKLQVLNLDDGTPGTIVVDTLPTTGSGSSHCQSTAGGRKVIDAKTSTGSLIRAEGGIKVFAGRPGSEWEFNGGISDPDNTYTWPVAAVNGGQLDPRPSPGGPITRALVDHLYNCQVGGYPTNQPWSPSVGDQPIAPCPESTFQIVEDPPGQFTQIEVPAPPPYLERLEETVTSVMADPAGAGWNVLDCDDTDSVKNGGNWVVPCSDTFGPDGLTFVDAGHIIFENGLSLSTGDEIKIYGTDADGGGTGTTVTMYTGGLETSGGVLEFRGVFTYIRSTTTGSEEGRLRVGANTERFALQAPLDDSGCTFQYGEAGELPPGPPEAACFSPLAMWSNYVGSGQGNRQNSVSGNASGGLVGTLFTPNSRFIFRGSGDIDPSCGAPSWDQISNTSATLELQGAQFFASRINLAAAVEIGMCPSPSTTIPTDPERVVSLLR